MTAIKLADQIADDLTDFHNLNDQAAINLANHYAKQVAAASIALNHCEDTVETWRTIGRAFNLVAVMHRRIDSRTR